MRGRVLSFQKKRKNQRKVVYVFLPICYLNSNVFGMGYIREAATLSCAVWRAQSQRRFLLPAFVAHASYNLTSFRDSANGRFLFRQVSPAPCSPPLGGSDGCSAVRFTPAVKYGGRENSLSQRATRCIRCHPYRAHHKLKWARKLQSFIVLLYKRLSRSESGETIYAAKFRCPLTLRRPPKLRKVNPVRQGLATTP